MCLIIYVWRDYINTITCAYDDIRKSISTISPGGCIIKIRDECGNPIHLTDI